MNLINLSKLADSEANAPQLFSAVYTNRYIKKKVASRCPLNASTNSYTRKKVASRSQLYADPKGRSMVEMLGVLAIIGVLSVGAIAGYSKAMMKYRLNKHAEDLNLLLTNCLQLSKQLPTDNVWKVYTNILPKLNLLPDSVKAYPDGNMRDIFKNTLYFYHTSSQGRWGIFHDIPESSYGNEICVNIIKTTKEYHAELYGVYRSKNHVSDSPTGYGMSEQYLGDKYCNHADKKCMSDMTISDIQNLCTDKGENAGDFNQYFLWITWYPADF